MDECYTDECSASGHTRVLHLFRGLEFRPERICNERMEMSGDGSVYAARCGAWDGMPWDSWQPAFPCLSSPFDPRVVVYRAVGGSYQNVDSIYDTADVSGLRRPDGAAASDDPDSLYVTWDSSAGVVEVGREAVAMFHGPGSGSNTPDIAMANAFTYLIAPAFYENVAGGVPSKIIDDDVQVSVGGLRYSRTDTWQPSEIGRGEFYFDVDNSPAAYLPSGAYNERGELRFSQFSPPDLSYGPLVVRYEFRRNFDPASGLDDMVKVDYSTRSIMNIALILADFLEPELRAEGETSDEVALASKVEIGNPGR
jgi:hypothetical protein